ncbi:hypothetical protein Ddc_16999 [Ditylenchus destructor]|nr:hypothetical protein Ddc_16999 [Ditylenchus destructor]
MSIPVLHFGLQRDIFALFNRPELSRISETNRRVNAIIEKHFTSSPRLIFDYVHYKNGVWKWLANTDLGETDATLEAAASPMSDSQIAQLKTSKYLRFRRFHFNDQDEITGFRMLAWNIMYQIIFNPLETVLETVLVTVLNFFRKRTKTPQEELEAHNHLWEGQRLSINITNFTPSTEFASTVNTCHDLVFKAPGALRMLSQLLRKSMHIKIDDTTENSTDQLPVAEIINFLLRRLHGDLSDFHHLALVTHYELQYQHFAAIMDGIRQKFLETQQPPMFLFEVEGSDLNWPHTHTYTLEHPSDKKLWFNKFDRFFRFTCSTHDLNVP